VRVLEKPWSVPGLYPVYSGSNEIPFPPQRTLRQQVLERAAKAREDVFPVE
jgi:hypothetical protein